MKTNQSPANTSNKRLIGILLGAALLLMVPLMLQLTIGTGVDGKGFNWKLDDFIVFGIMVFSAGLLSEFVLRKVRSKKNRLLLCGIILLIFLLVWMDLAVGIFNIPGFSGS